MLLRLHSISWFFSRTPTFKYFASSTIKNSSFCSSTRILTDLIISWDSKIVMVLFLSLKSIGTFLSMIFFESLFIHYQTQSIRSEDLIGMIGWLLRIVVVGVLCWISHNTILKVQKVSAFNVCFICTSFE